MRRVPVSLQFVSVLIFLLGANLSFAQPNGTLGFYFDTAYTQTEITGVQNFVQFNGYLVASDVRTVDPTAQMFGFETTVEVPAGFTVLARTLTPASALNVGAGNPDNFIVGLGVPVDPDADGNVLLVSYVAAWFSQDPVPQNVKFDMVEAVPTSFDPPVPGWLAFGGALYPFETVLPGRINPVACELFSASISGTTIAGLDDLDNELFSVDTGFPVSNFLVNDFDGDGDENLLYWTQSDGVGPGRLAQLDCQGNEVWSFSDSGLACAPTDGLVDVSSVSIGEFFAGNAGDEIFLVSTSNAASADDAVRVNVLDLEGNLLGTDGEYWVLGTFPNVIAVDGGALISATDPVSGNAFLVRAPLEALRGAYPTQSMCLSGGEDAVVVWDYEFGSTTGDPYFQQEAQITGLNPAGDHVEVFASSGETYELDPVTLQSLPCDLASIDAIPNGIFMTIRGFDGGGAEIWTYDVETPDLPVLDLYDAGGDPAVFAIAPTLGAFSIECHGKPAGWLPIATSTLKVAEAGLPSTSAAGSYFMLVDTGVQDVLHRITPSANVTSLNDVTWTTDGSVSVFRQGNADGDGVDNVYLAVDTAPGALVENLSAADLSNIWSALFNGAGQYPADPSGILDLTLGSNVVTLTTFDDTYDLDATTGDLLNGACVLDEAVESGGVLSLEDPDDNELFAYDPPGDLDFWTYVDDQAANKVVIGLADNGPDAIMFMVNCDGVVYETTLGGENCFELDVVSQNIDEAGRGGFTDPANDEWFVRISGGNGVVQIITADIPSGSVISVYDFLGVINEVRIDGTDYILAGRDGFLNAAAVVSLPAGTSGASAPCTTQKVGENWAAVFDGSAPDRLDESEIASTTFNGAETMFATALSGNTYELNVADGATVDCEWVTLTGSNGVYRFLDVLDNELAIVDLGVPGYATLTKDLGGSAEAEVLVLAGENGQDADVYALTCQGGGQVYWTFDSSDRPCFAAGPLLVEMPLAGRTPNLAGEELFVGRASDAYRVFTLADDGTLNGDYWHQGPLTEVRVDELLNDGRQMVLLLGTNAAHGGADLVFLDPTDLSGSFDGASCGPGSQLWSVDWDGNELPVETPEAISFEGLDRARIHMLSGNSYVVLLADGTVVSGAVAGVNAPAEAGPGDEIDVTVDAEFVAGVAGLDGKLTYDPAVFELVQANLGQLLAISGGFSEAINTDVAGEVSFAFARALPLDESEDEGEILAVRLRVLDDAPVGDTNVALDPLNLFDESGERVEVDVTGATIELECTLYDVSGDGELHSNDAVLALRIDVELITPTAQQFCAADIDENGAVEAGDAVAILREIVGLPPLGAAAKGGSVQLLSDGAVTLRGNRAQVPLTLTAHDMAGLDLTLRAEGARVVALTDGGGSVAMRPVGNGIKFASASAEPRSIGELQLEVVLELEADLDGVQLWVEAGAVFGTAGRQDVEPGEVWLEKGGDPIAPPASTRLLQNYPNPFNPRTQISFVLAHGGDVKLSVYDAAGRHVRTLLSASLDAGPYEVTWDGLDRWGDPVASGVYVYRLRAPSGDLSRQMTLVR